MGRLKLPVKVDKNLLLEYEIQVPHMHNPDVRFKPFFLCIKANKIG